MRTRKLLSTDLNTWNKTSFGKKETEISNIRIELEEIRLIEPNEKRMARELELSKNLEEFFIREECLWRQKSKEEW